MSTSGCLGLVESFVEGENHAQQGGADQLRVQGPKKWFATKEGPRQEQAIFSGSVHVFN